MCVLYACFSELELVEDTPTLSAAMNVVLFMAILAGDHPQRER